MPKDPRNLVINYTSRDFASIKQDLVNYAKRYYPDTFKDFNEASFGALMLDTVAYVGDILSFYLDYNVNETFLDSATEFNNITRLGRQFGYKFAPFRSSSGLVTFYILVPANSTGTGPNKKYMPILERGSILSSTAGNQFILVENVDFADSDNEVVTANVNSTTGLPTAYAVRAYGRVASGRYGQLQVDLDAFERFRKIRLGIRNMTEIISVVDSVGNEYYEVEHLAQNVIYRQITNTGSDKALVSSIMKPFVVPRRFVLERTYDDVFLQFGHGSDSELTSPSVADPANLVLNMHGRDYVTDKEIDPTKLIKTDKFGIAPANTTLTITYRANDAEDVNASSNSITNVINAKWVFTNPSTLSLGSMATVRNSLEASNEEPITGDISLPTTDELRQRIMGAHASQGRAVTRQDYLNLVYSMPAQFGGVKRCNIVQDPDSFKRNLNLYTISENNAGNLIETNNTIKENLKTWLSKNKMINDTIDILDAKIVNLEIKFEAIADGNGNKYDILQNAIERLQTTYFNHFDIGESFSLSNVYKVLNCMPGIVDVTDVSVRVKTGGAYASTKFQVEPNLTSDGRTLIAPENVIFEIKYGNSDIIGTIK